MVVKELPLTPDGKLHFKHHSQRFAFAACQEIGLSRLILHTKTNGGSAQGSERLWFDDVDALLQAGWVLD